MKRNLKWIALFVIVLSLSVFFALSASAETEGYYTYTVTGEKVTITDVDTAISGDIVIPDTLGGYPVTSIGNSAFEECSNLTGIEIPSSVTSIGNLAFSYTALQSIEIPSSVESIGNSAFSYCGALQSIEIPSSVESIGSSAFQYCSSLTGIELPNSVTSIGERAFYSCSSLTSIEIPSGVTSIGKYMFYNCYNLADIYYSGSEEDWNAVSKGNSWDNNAGRDTEKGTYTLHFNYVAPAEISDADIIAYQVTKAENGLFSIRAIAGMNSLLYKNFGYEVTITTKDELGNDVVQTLSGSDDKVYSSVYGGEMAYSIKDMFGYEYGGLATIADLDIDSTYTKIEIRAYVTTAKGEVKYGKSATILYTGTTNADGYPEFTSVTA